MKAHFFVVLQLLSFVAVVAFYSGCSSASAAHAQTASEMRVVERT